MSRPLITVQELARSLSETTVLDVRWQLGQEGTPPEYEAGHIPGAAFVDLDRMLAAPPGPGGRHPLPSSGALEAAMRDRGVSNDRPVVVYDASSGHSAARAWWVLRYFGHPDVAVLDGGIAAWTAAGQPLEAGVSAASRGDFTAHPGGMPLLDAGGAAAIASTGVLLDARAPERFRGESEPVDPVWGHIPGARNRPATDNVASDGRFRDPAELRAAFEALGAGDGTRVGAYCGSGVAAAQEILALELAGYPAALYVGSWSDWITDPDRPVATGPG